MHETLAFIVFAFSLTGTPILVGAALVLVVVILGAALFIFRSSGKKKGTAANKAGAGADWQRQQGQQGQPGAPAAWNQQGMGGAGDNAWAQPQQPGAWGAQSPAQQQPGVWGAQSPAQQQPGVWGAQSPAAQQQPNAWDAQMPQQQQPNVWGAQSSAQQPNAWETQLPAQQQPAANTWGSPSSPLQQPNAWGAQSPAQPQPGVWGNATPNTPSTNGMGGNQSWDATSLPQQPAASAQDAWAQPQQPGTPAWGMQNNMPAQQQAPTAYGGNSAPNAPWGQANQNQPAPAQQNNWAQPNQNQPAPVNDSWGQAAPAQQNNWGSSPLQPPTTTGGNSMTPAWQQAPGQGLGGSTPGGGAGGFVAPFGNNENDRTMIRSTGPQGSLGVVRVEEGKEPGRVYEVRKDELSIGRSRESDIFLEDLAVSRLHAKIVSLGSGNYALKDEGSANGTKVNGQLVNKYQSHTLQEGDRIQLGQTVLVFAKR
nr:FHA domain-containing protein [Ktedonobacteraceae bacterium]